MSLGAFHLGARDEPLLRQLRRLPPPLYLLSDCPVETALLI